MLFHRRDIQPFHYESLQLAGVRSACVWEDVFLSDSPLGLGHEMSNDIQVRGLDLADPLGACVQCRQNGQQQFAEGSPLQLTHPLLLEVIEARRSHLVHTLVGSWWGVHFFFISFGSCLG